MAYSLASITDGLIVLVLSYWQQLSRLKGGKMVHLEGGPILGGLQGNCGELRTTSETNDRNRPVFLCVLEIQNISSRGLSLQMFCAVEKLKY